MAQNNKKKERKKCPVWLAVVVAIAVALIVAVGVLAATGKLTGSDGIFNKTTIAYYEDGDNIQRNYTLKLNETAQLDSHILGDGVVWESNNPDIVSVTDSGLITALKTGNTVIKASVNKNTRNEKTIRYNVNVPEDTTPEGYSVTVGECRDLPPILLEGALTYKSSDESILTVDEEGTVTFVGIGKAYVEVSNGTENTYFYYTVSEKTEETSEQDETLRVFTDANGRTCYETIDDYTE